MSDVQSSVSLCIVNFNGERYLLESLSAAMAQTTGFAEILLIDNASDDGSLEIVRSCFPQVRILALEENRGPGAARNAGYAAATGDLILFQDNDVRMQPDCSELLSAFLRKHGRALLVAPRVVHARSPGVIQYDSADCHFLGLMALRNAERDVRQCDTVASLTTSLVTACFMIDRTRWPEAELFDETFGFNLEDHDFGIRANVRGLETWIEPRAVAVHGEGTSGLSWRPGEVVPARRIFFLVRNRWLIIWATFSPRTLAMLFPLLVLYELFQFAGLASKGFLRPWGRAARSFLLLLPHLRRKRGTVQSTRRTHDRELLRAGPLPFTGAFQSGRFARIAVSSMNRFANAYWKLVRAFI